MHYVILRRWSCFDECFNRVLISHFSCAKIVHHRRWFYWLCWLLVGWCDSSNIHYIPLNYDPIFDKRRRKKLEKFISFGYQLVGTMPEFPYDKLNVFLSLKCFEQERNECNQWEFEEPERDWTSVSYLCMQMEVTCHKCMNSHSVAALKITRMIHFWTSNEYVMCEIFKISITCMQHRALHYGKLCSRN